MDVPASVHLGRKTSCNAESWDSRADFNAWVQTCLELAKVQGEVQRVQSHIIDLTTTLSEALVFDVDPSVLLISGLGLRETDIDRDGAVSRGRDFNLAPNAAVLCPKDNRAIRFERLSPQTQEYFCVYEGGEPGGGVNAYSTSRAHKYTAGFEIPQLVPICEAMSHEIKGNFISPEWPSYDGESIFMQDPSFQTPCWRYWVNRQKTSGVKDISWDELHELWTDAFGAVETRAPSNTSVAEIERILHKPARRPTHGRVHRKGSARLSAPTTPFEDRFYSAAKPS